MLSSRKQVLRLVNVFRQKKARIVREADRTPLLLADDYADWYRQEFAPWLASQITMEAGRWQPGDPTVISQAGQRVLRGATSIILNPLNDWLPIHYPKFWLSGLDLWRVNMEIIGEPTPRKLKLTDAEIDRIAVLVTEEQATQSDHVQRHRRYVERMVSGGLQMGWTLERFMKASTAPDGGIVGYPIGNSRYSWQYHMGLLVTGRSKAIACAAQEYRMSRGQANG